MEEGTKSKRTVYIGGLSEDTDEALIYETFSTFGMLVLFGALWWWLTEKLCRGRYRSSSPRSI